ncbi:MAG TPA: hypothetical protein V6C91_00215 [Coleofasciculaceae cyanobacterium]
MHSERIFTGKLVTVDLWDRLVEAIVIDPNGQEEGKPTLGMGFGMTERHMGIDQSTLSRWAVKEDQSLDANKICMSLKLPSGKRLPLMQITDETNREQLVIEASDWTTMAADILKKPGKLRQETKDKVIDFLAWFATKGFYASCYSKIFGAYTAEDDSKVSALLIENSQLQEKLRQADEAMGQMAIEYALLEYKSDRDQYLIDELQRDMAWHRSNSWGGRDLR